MKLSQKVNLLRRISDQYNLSDYRDTLKFALVSSPFVKALSNEEVRERIKMICAGEPGDKASFPDILAIVSMEEKLARLKVNNQTDLFYLCSRSGYVW